MEATTDERKGRVSYNAKERQDLIAEFNSSGLTQAAFCREWNIHPTTFSSWMRSERDEGKPNVSFCEVETLPQNGTVHEVLIRLPNQVQIVVSAGADFDLGSVLREAAACLG